MSMLSFVLLSGSKLNADTNMYLRTGLGSFQTFPPQYDFLAFDEALIRTASLSNRQ